MILKNPLLRFMRMKNTYPTIITAVSPIATRPTLGQNEQPSTNKANSAPTMNELNTIGKIAATHKCLQKQIAKQANNVAVVPKATSIIPIVENKLAIAQPTHMPML